MQYSPKLKQAAEEIKQVLLKYDIAAFVALHTPGWGEYIMRIDPTYSCAKIVEIGNDSGIRIRAKLQEDFNGDEAKRHQVVTDTVNMLDTLAMLTGQHAVGIMDMLDMLKDKIERLPGDGYTGPTTSHTQQNN